MPETDYMKLRLKIKQGLSPRSAKKIPQDIKGKSEKMRIELKKYIPAAKEFLARPENKECKIKMPGCSGLAVCVHHSAGRIGIKLHDQADWVPSCANCNLRVEIKDLEARSKGFKKSRLNQIDSV